MNIWKRKNIIFFSALVLVSLACQDRFARNKMVDVVSTKSSDENLLEYLSKKDGTNKDIVYQTLLAFQDNDWIGLSENHANQISEAYASDMEISLLLFEFFRQIGGFDDAKIHADRAEKLGANAATFYRDKGSLLATLGENEKAIDYINKALMLDDGDFTIYKAKGDIYLSMRDTLTAIQFYETSFERNPKQLEVLKYLIALYASLNQYDEAKLVLDRAVAMDSASSSILNLKAEVLYNSGDELGGLACYKKILDQFGETAAGMKLANHYSQNSLLDSTLYFANRVLVLDSINFEALMVRAEVFDRRGYYTSAMMNYQKVLDVDSTHQEALAGLNKVNGKIAYLRKLKEQREAIPSFDFASPEKKKKIN